MPDYKKAPPNLICIIAYCLFLYVNTGNGLKSDSIPIIEAKEDPKREPANPIAFFDACVLNIKEWLDTSTQEDAYKDPCEDVAINTAYRRCAQLLQVDLESQVRDNEEMSGHQIIAAFDSFCTKRADVHTCVGEHLKNYSCSNADVQNFKEAAAEGEYYCDGRDVRPFIVSIYQDIPAVGTRTSRDKCMALAYSRHNTCLLPHLLAAVLGHEKDDLDLGWKLENLLCVLKGFGRKGCDLNQGILTTSLIHGHLLVPPVYYGINVTKYILDMDTYARRGNQRKSYD